MNKATVYSFHPPPIEPLKGLKEAAQNWKHMVLSQVETRLRDAIKRKAGYMPRLQEASEHLEKLVAPDGTQTFKWKGETILRVMPFDFDSRAARIRFDEML